MMRLLTIYATLCLIAFFGALLQPILVSSDAVANFFPQSEPFTELYFEDHLSLPARLAPYTQYSFRFTIHNRTEENIEYQYLVSAEIDGESFVLNQGSVFIDTQASLTIQEKFVTVQEIPSKSKIVVTLPHTNQHIAFWMEKNE